MPVEALVLALAAAALHAFWNLVVARARDVEAATALVVALSVVAFAPVAAATWNVSTTAVPYLVASGTLELVYFALLAAAYRRAELSLVYPIARGGAPVVVLIGGIAALGERTSAGEVAGVALVAVGIVLVRGGRGHAARRGIALALLLACCIAAYTLVDSRGVRHADPLPYLELALAPTATLYLGAMLRLKGRAAVRRELNGATVGCRSGLRRLRARARRAPPGLAGFRRGRPRDERRACGGARGAGAPRAGRRRPARRRGTRRRRRGAAQPRLAARRQL